MRHAAIGKLEAASYVRHALHRIERAWPETNCYADLWIELLHALGLEPLACLAFTVAVDFEGDQWTFFKPSHAELHHLFGVDVQELNIWRGLEAQAVEQVRRGRLVLAEVDAFYLPDTAGTDYRRQHTKTTVAIEAIDPEAGTLGYFHNAGYFELGPEDYRSIFGEPAPGALPTYVEFAKISALRKLHAPELTRRAVELLSHQLARAPRENPVTAFGPRFVEDVEKLKRGELPSYHLYAFAGLRQLGAAFELAAHHLLWLEQNGEAELAPIAASFDKVSATAKTMILKTARAVTNKKPVDFAPLLAELEAGYSAGMQRLTARYGR
jgi:hypothetical protein